MSALGTALQGLTRSADLSGFGWGPYADGTIPPNSYAIGDYGRPITEEAALRLGDANACIALLSDAVSMLPFAGFRADAGDVRRKLPSQPQIIAQPDPECLQSDYVGQVVTSLATRGNAYSPILEFDGRGFPTATRCIHPDDVRVRRSQKTNVIEYELRDGSMIPKGGMIHITLRRLGGSVIGMSPIELNRRGLRLAIDTEEFGDTWFRDGAAPSSVFETDQDMEDREANRVVAKWIATHQGRRRPGILTGGLKWRPITLTPNESQFLETRKLNTAAIARIWRIPPHMIGDVDRDTSWGTGIEQQGIAFVVYTLGVYLQRIEAAFSSSKVSPRGQYAKFNVGALLRGDTKTRYEGYAIGRQWGWLSVNDIRALEDMPPVEGGDTYLQPLNMVDAEKALAALKLTQATDQGAAA